jgi:hypothetical protein
MVIVIRSTELVLIEIIFYDLCSVVITWLNVCDLLTLKL